MPKVPSAIRRSAASIIRTRVPRWLVWRNRDSFARLPMDWSPVSCGESTSNARVSLASRLRSRRASSRRDSSFHRYCLIAAFSMIFTILRVGRCTFEWAKRWLPRTLVYPELKQGGLPNPCMFENTRARPPALLAGCFAGQYLSKTPVDVLPLRRRST